VTFTTLTAGLSLYTGVTFVQNSAGGHIQMKQLILLAATIVVLRVPGTAAPCAPGTLASYMTAAAGCTLGTLTVSRFTYKASAKGGAATITPEQIAVEPLLAPVGNAGLQFTAPWKADKGQAQGSQITYRVVAGPASTPPSKQIKQLMLNGSGFTGGLVTSAIVTEAAAAASVASALTVYEKCGAATVCQTKTSSSVIIKPASALVVSDKVALTAKKGSTSIGNFADWFSICPPCVN
jgi:hypothetical protein